MGQYRAFVQSILVTISLITAIFAGMFWSFSQWSDWSGIPDKVNTLTENQGLFAEAIVDIKNLIKDQNKEYQLVDIQSGQVLVLTPEVKPGGTIWIAFYARANASCDRDIEVQFFNHDTRAMHPEVAITKAVRSAVSSDYQLLVVPIKVFNSLPHGTYSYAATIVPEECGVYRRQVVPLSNSFKVIE